MVRSSVILILALLLFQVGCKSPTGPEMNNPRNYKWSVDTLYISPNQILLDRVWGTSADNLYAVGHSSSSTGTMWHFDGNRWTNVKLGLFEGGTIPAPFDLAGIHGLNANNIFAVGNRSPFLPGASFIIHYDGNQWTEQQAPPESNSLRAVWMNSPTDVWACGFNGTLLHYDGTQWIKDSVVVNTPSGSTFQLGSIVRIPSGEMFMLGAAYEVIPPQMLLRWTYYFVRRVSNVWMLHDTFVRNDGERGGKWGGGGRLTVLPSGTMYSVDSYGGSNGMEHNGSSGIATLIIPLSYLVHQTTTFLLLVPTDCYFTITEVSGSNIWNSHDRTLCILPVGQTKRRYSFLVGLTGRKLSF